MGLINCFSDVYMGAHWLKSVPLRCPPGAPQENSTTAFAYTRTVVWAYANGCLGIRKRLFGRTQTVITLRQTPCNSVPFSYFGGTLSLNKGTLTTKEICLKLRCKYSVYFLNYQRKKQKNAEILNITLHVYAEILNSKTYKYAEILSIFVKARRR